MFYSKDSLADRVGAFRVLRVKGLGAFFCAWYFGTFGVHQHPKPQTLRFLGPKYFLFWLPDLLFPLSLRTPVRLYCYAPELTLSPIRRNLGGSKKGGLLGFRVWCLG